MSKELNIKKEELKLKGDLKKIFSDLQLHTKLVPNNIKEQVGILFKLRSEIYEDLNQLQHIALLLNAATLLKKDFPEINRWSWHPKQTSKPDEADLTGYKDNKVIISVEVTTSIKPNGSIDTRMRNTLNSLNSKKGKLYYFVQTDEMFKRAEHKIKISKWNITAQIINGRTGNI